MTACGVGFVTPAVPTLDRPDEERLVEAARSGDDDAYATLVARHQDVAFRAAFLITRSAPEAQDAAQEAFVKAWLALDRFRAGAAFRPWLLRIVTNEALNRRRSSGRRDGLVLQAARVAEGTSPGADTAALAGDERARLLAAVGALRESDQLVIAARYFLGLSESEASEVLQWRPGTVKSRLARALDRLRSELGETA